MCAMMPMLRTRSSGYSRTMPDLPALVSMVISQLPLVMGERLIGFGHLVRLLLAANGGTGVVHGVHELTGELLGHRLTRTLASGLDEPAHRERAAAGRRGLDRELVGGATGTARPWLY